jgi:hypothetical protein
VPAYQNDKLQVGGWVAFCDIGWPVMWVRPPCPSSVARLCSLWRRHILYIFIPIFCGEGGKEANIAKSMSVITRPEG